MRYSSRRSPSLFREGASLPALSFRYAFVALARGRWTLLLPLLLLAAGTIHLLSACPAGGMRLVGTGGMLKLGAYQAVSDGSMLPSGIYWLVLDTPGLTVRERMVVVR